MAITSDLDRFRLLIGDTNEDAPLFNDVEANFFIGERSDVHLAAADACESLALRFARDYDMTVDGTSLKRGQVSKAYAERAKVLRDRAGGLGVMQFTRIDGRSDDVSARDGAGGTTDTGRVRAGYRNPDLP